MSPLSEQLRQLNGQFPGAKQLCFKRNCLKAHSPYIILQTGLERNGEEGASQDC